MVLRMGDHTLFVSGTAKSPIDFKAANRITEQIKLVLGEDLEKELGGMDLAHACSTGDLTIPRPTVCGTNSRTCSFNEAWIPELKKSELDRVLQLYDLSKDLGQQNNIVKTHPNLSPE